jgi:PHD/YefM family antitoxin component YafN of YafNO toxin-antitoxin module
MSSLCSTVNEPVFFREKGQNALVVMSMETYEMLMSELELGKLLDEGHADVLAGRVRPFEDVMHDLFQELEGDTLQN